jgi:hypothetical protein
MRVMRSNLDGSDIQTLMKTGHGESDRQDARNWCVGIALDVDGGKLYWTQKGNDNAGLAASFGQIWKFRRVKVPQIAKISKSSSIICPSP